MKADNTETGHNRTIRLTGIEGSELDELLITVNYVEAPCEDRRLVKAVTLDGVVIPAIIDALNGDVVPMSTLRDLADKTSDLPNDDKYNTSDFGESWKEINRIIVEDERGMRAIAFVSDRIERGRIKFGLTVKKNNYKETKANATADWII